jgi:hypothetical protein
VCCVLALNSGKTRLRLFTGWPDEFVKKSPKMKPHQFVLSQKLLHNFNQKNGYTYVIFNFLALTKQSQWGKFVQSGHTVCLPNKRLFTLASGWPGFFHEKRIQKPTKIAQIVTQPLLSKFYEWNSLNFNTNCPELSKLPHSLENRPIWSLVNYATLIW